MSDKNLGPGSEKVAISSNFEDSKHFEKMQLTCRLTGIPKQAISDFLGDLRTAEHLKRLRRLKA